MIYRIALLVLLPVAAVVVYLEGQRYNPALIDFKSIQSGTETLPLPPDIDGFFLSGQVRVYTGENLFEYVNGHAEYFIGAGFMNLSVADYIKTGTEPFRPDATVEVYDMGKTLHAFGVLIDEAGDHAPEEGMGVMGFRTSDGVSFFKGRYYIKIRIFHKSVPLASFIRIIENTIDVTGEPFLLFERFPDLGEIVTTRFVKDGYRGLDFMQNVIEREYKIDGQSIHVSLVTGGEKEMEELTSRFLRFFEQSRMDYKRSEKSGREFYRVKDPYEGDWYLIPLTDAVFGVYGEMDEDGLDLFLE